MTNIFKRKITIHDKDGKKFDLKIENNSDHFSICSQSGQGQFNPKSDIQQQLLDIWNTYHLNGMSAGTEKQIDIVNLLEDKSYNNIKDYLSKHKLDGSDLSIVEYDKSNKAIEEYKQELRLFNSFCKKLIEQKSETIITYTPEEGEEKYFEDFKLSAGDSIVIKGDKILQPRNLNRSPGHDDILKILNRMDEVKYSNDIYLSALVDEYKGKPFIYGLGWAYKDFPENFEEDLFNLIDKLIEEEDEYNERKITIEDIDNEKFIEHAKDYCMSEVDKLMAACIHCGVSWTGLENVTFNGDGSYWDVEGFDYYIYTDEEADDACKDNIKETAWAFNSDFIISHSKVLDYDKGSYDILKAIQEQCENGNDAILRLIDDIDEFSDNAISSDGRGHFLAGYDGYENEVEVNGTTYYLYRNN